MSISLSSRSTMGVIVLIALLIIFLPLLLRGRPTDTLQFSPIPALPPRPSTDQLALNSAKSATKDLFSSYLPTAKAWAIQLTDFKEPAAADSLVQTLRHKGFKAYRRQVSSLTGVINRVFVGPEIKVNQIQQLQMKLNKAMSLTTTVVAFDPLLVN